MNWFNQLPRRDQMVLVVGGFIISVILIWVLVLDPLAKSVQRYSESYEYAKRDLAEVKSLAAEYKQYQAMQGQQSNQSSSSLDSLVTRAMNQNQLSFTSKTPSGNNRVTIRFDNAKYENMVQWLYDLEVGQGVQVENLTLTASGQPGYVLASVRLRKN